MTARPFVVVGASLAGLRAVEAARRSGWTGPVVLIGAEPHLRDRPPLTKDFLVPDAEPTWFTQEAHLAELGVELVLGRPAAALDTAARTVRVGDREVPHGPLVIATGSAPRTLPGHRDLPGLITLRTAPDENRVVVGDLDGPRFVALYRSGDRVAGALAVNEPGKIMKYRRLIQNRGSWAAALELYSAPAA